MKDNLPNLKEKSISLELIEDKIPKLREVVTKFIFNKIASSVSTNDDVLSLNEIKTYADLTTLVEKITDCIQQNRAFSVDLSMDNDILVDEIFWTDERLKQIENYILPDLQNYIEYSEVKKKIKKKKIKKLLIK
jgi:hypothetical protein